MEALDRFARFFTEPSLTRDCTEREINAVPLGRVAGTDTEVMVELPGLVNVAT